MTVTASLYTRAGETWGLYFSDYEDELRQLLEDSTERWLLLTRMCAGQSLQVPHAPPGGQVHSSVPGGDRGPVSR